MRATRKTPVETVGMREVSVRCDASQKEFARLVRKVRRMLAQPFVRCG